MKPKQRVLLNKITKAIAKGRKKGYLPTIGTIYTKNIATNNDIQEYACAYGALAAGLDIDIAVITSEGALDDIVYQVGYKLGIEEACNSYLYPIIYAANDQAVDNGDLRAIKALEKRLEDDPEFCA